MMSLVYFSFIPRLIENLKDAGKERKNGASFIMWQDVLKNTKAVSFIASKLNPVVSCDRLKNAQ